MDEQWLHNLGCVQAWVEAGETREERSRRLEQVPEHLKPSVRSHVHTVFVTKWTAYVLKGRTEAERKGLLAHVPDALREDVQANVMRRQRLSSA